MYALVLFNFTWNMLIAFCFFLHSKSLQSLFLRIKFSSALLTYAGKIAEKYSRLLQSSISYLHLVLLYKYKVHCKLGWHILVSPSPLSQHITYLCWHAIWLSNVYFLFVCVEVIIPLKNFSHMETSPLPVKGCKFCPMLGTQGKWAVRIL